MKFFSGSSNMPLGKKIAQGLHITLSPINLHEFPDGERRIQIQERVVGENCIIVQSTNTPVETNYMELFFIIDGLKRSGAEFVTAVVPYFGYQRQDHVFREGEAVSLEVMIKFLETSGVSQVISIDMHSVKIPDLFHVNVRHLSGLPLFADTIKEKNWQQDTVILISPDMGGIARIKKLSTLLNNMPYAAIEKERDLESGMVRSSGFGEGDLNGATHAIIVDDMISSGGTIIAAAEVLKTKGVEKISVFATHAIFSEDAQDTLQNSAVDSVFVTDTVFIPKAKYFPKLQVLSVSDIIAQEIRKISNF